MEDIKEHGIEDEELIVNRIDPIIISLLHESGDDKIFIWNRTALQNYETRPNAGCVALKEKDLIRLSLFGMNALEKHNSKCILLTNHYVNFINDVLAEIDKFPEMKGQYLIMDNAPIYTELNSIEQFWSVIKSSVKREFVLKKTLFLK
ncbi:hypothetical protein BDF20DRAFT_912329 [Mycotypha africana]|uniref:uncharacterized protein n=1 Tax=Mycotypha africana TaxID=64632 RepID=UPI002300BD22|nr:uncharacterized protein BDF20DRAFT_912329 [Mycotypha africana]KAI8982122.1 hypothetical protein BDF20DRAFT_912329 [Mycotypha africana]